MNEKHNNTIAGIYKINMKLTCIIWPHSIGQNYLTHCNKLLQKKEKLMMKHFMFFDGATFPNLSVKNN
jgi:hypothetical protein